MLRNLLLLICFALISWQSISQGLSVPPLNEAQIHGDFTVDFQTYQEDSAIGAQEVPEGMGLNAYGNINFSIGNFYGGFRFEAFQPPLLGFDPRWEGVGIPYRFFGYRQEGLDITVGNFYEQYGSGMLQRTYWEWYLGYDTFYEGVRVRYSPSKWLNLKGMVGRQRLYFEYGDGLVRAIDGEVDFGQIFPGLSSSGYGFLVGGSFVSRYQEDNNPFLIYPENVGSGAVRAVLSKGNFILNTEYATKANDPSAINGNNYRRGEALLVNGSYSQRGFGVNLGFKRWDNMDFRTDRTATGFDQLINFNPAMSKQHTYRTASMYAYATVPVGEIGWQADIFYKFKRGSGLGGKYGTLVTVNFSQTNDIVRDSIQPPDNDTREFFTSPFFAFGEKKFFVDFNIEIEKKFSRKVKGIFTYLYQERDNSVQPVTFTGSTETVLAHMGIVDIEYKFSSKNVLRTEFQYLHTRQDYQDWSIILTEYTMAPHWFFSALWEYNFGNNNEDLRLHYFTGYVGYRQGATSIRLGYGRQRQGVLCVGGVCRIVPASNGAIVTITSSF